MTKHLRVDLENLEKRLLLLGAKVEDAVRKSMMALRERRRDIAREVVEGDIEIDREEVALEDMCLKVLALHQPVASDLRFVTAVLKTNNDLERIADLAKGLGKRMLELPDRKGPPPPPGLEPMKERVMQMLRQCLDAFVQADSRLAQHVLAEDDRVDDAHREILQAMIARLKESDDDVDVVMLYMAASRSLERIADHATNIAEDVVYMVEGEIIRHRPA